MKKIIYFLIFASVLSSCGVQYKQIPYFQDLNDTINIEEDITNNNQLKIQKDDILAITVSSLNEAASAIFNLGNTSSNPANAGGSNNPAMTANGFLVDKDGAIRLPLIGAIKVEGLTTAAARDLIQSKLGNYLKEPVVSLRLVNFKVSVLGDVSKPGVYPIQNERVSVADALSLAGDLNITALRKNILLVRELNGKRQYIRLNIQSKSLFNSPYFYLQNNDVLYVQPGNAKYASVDTNYRNIGIVFSAISILALILSRL